MFSLSFFEESSSQNSDPIKIEILTNTTHIKNETWIYGDGVELICDSNKLRSKDSTVHWLAWNKTETTWKFVVNQSWGLISTSKENNILKFTKQNNAGYNSQNISYDLSTRYICMIWWENNTVSFSNQLTLRYPGES